MTDRRTEPRAGSETTEFLQLVQQRERGRLKLYIGSAAGTGKTYRMLQEAHELRRRGVDAVIGYVETHGRTDTVAQLGDLETVPRRRIAYRTVELEEMDLDAVIARRPRVALVDELAHTNVPGSRHQKRWQDVLALLDEGITVLSAVNVQHLESLNGLIAQTTGVTVRETVPDWVVASADQVVNLDIAAEDLRQRLREGKIYRADKIESALANFFTDENLSTLRELALREVANTVDRAREAASDAVIGGAGALRRRSDRLLVAMSSNPPHTAVLLRNASRIAGRLNSDWICVYVQTAAERPDRIETTIQRQLVENIHMAQRLGAEVVKLEGEDVVAEITRCAQQRGVSLVIAGQPNPTWWERLRGASVVDRLVNNDAGLNVLVVAVTEG